MTPTFRDLLLIGAVLAVYTVFRRVAYRVFRLPESDYFRRCIVLAGLRRRGVAVGAAALCVPGLWLGTGGWGAFDDAAALRTVVVTAVLLIAWITTTYDINHYYGRTHAADRLVVAALAAGAVANPAFVAPFLVAAMLVWHQASHPWGVNQSFTDKLLVIDALVGFTAWIAVGAAAPVLTWHYLALLLGLVATYYFYPGLAKLRIGPRPWSWVACNRLHNLIRSTWVYGHLGFLSERAMLRVARAVRPLNVPLQAATLAVELGVVLMPLSQDLTIGILACLIVMHAAIFLSSGLAFWKWAVLDAAIIAGLMVAGPATLGPLFSWPVLLAVGVTVALGPWHSQPAWLVWYDGPLVNLLRYEVVDPQGRTWNLPNAFIGPYDQPFCQGRIHWIIPAPMLVGIFGNIRRTDGRIGSLALMRLLERTGGDAARVARLRRRFGLRRLDPKRAEHFDRFIRRYFANLNASRRRRLAPRLLCHPKHFHHWTRDPAYRMQSPVTSFRAWYVEAYADDRGVSVLGEFIVREVEVPSAPLPATFEVKPLAGAGAPEAKRPARPGIQPSPAAASTAAARSA